MSNVLRLTHMGFAFYVGFYITCINQWFVSPGDWILVQLDIFVSYDLFGNSVENNEMNFTFFIGNGSKLTGVINH